MNKSILNVLAIALLGISSTVHSQENNIREWEAFVGKFIPDEITNSAAINDLLVAAKPGKPFSETFNTNRAQVVFVDKVTLEKHCFLETLPNGELPQEECNSSKGSPLGEAPASVLSYNVGDGSVRYMNRGREPQAAVAAKLTQKSAADALVKMSQELGIPAQELGQVQVKDLIVAGSPAEQGNLTAIQGKAPQFEQRVGVFGIIPRCMPVAGQIIKTCVPVVDGGIRSALVDGGRREPAIVSAWYQARFNTFEIPAGLKPLSSQDVVSKIADKLNREANLGSLDQLQIKLVYATNAELGGQAGDVHCAPDEADEEDAAPFATTTAANLLPANVMSDRSYLPAVQVFALPKGWNSSLTIDPDKINSLSSGIAVFTVALAQGDSSQCQAQ
jgi:hypothetical protein